MPAHIPSIPSQHADRNSSRQRTTATDAKDILKNFSRPNGASHISLGQRPRFPAPQSHALKGRPIKCQFTSSIPNSFTQGHDLITNILGTLDEKIKLNRRMNATLESMARALYQSWFVDFDPVRRNAARLQNQPSSQPSPNRRGRSAAQGEGAAGRKNAESATPRPAHSLFTDLFEDSAMGEIPKGWTVKPLDEIAEYQNGLALQKFRPANDEDPLPIVKIAQLKSGEATWEELSGPAINPACIIDTGDVVFSWSGPLVVKIWCGGRAALNQHLFKVTSEKHPKWFYVHWTQKHLSDFQRIAEDKAVTMGHIKRSHLKEALCVIPDVKVLEEGTKRIAPLIDQMISLEGQSRSLFNLRATLLPKLLSGRFSQ